MNETIILWGDSIGKGVVYSEERKRYMIAKDRCVNLLRAAGLDIESHAVMGATIADGYEQFLESETKPGSHLVIEYGGNDCDPDWDAVAREPECFHDGRTPLAQFRALLGQFIEAGRQRGLRPVLAVPPPLDAQRYFRWISQQRSAERILRYLGDVQHIYRWHERYVLAIHDVARAYDCPELDLRSPFLDARFMPGLICRDGIHPNEAGQRLMADTALSVLGLHSHEADDQMSASAGYAQEKCLLSCRAAG